MTNIWEFRRKLKCRAFFYHKDEQKDIDLDKKNSFKPRSNWTPEVTNPVLDLFRRRLDEVVLSLKELEIRARNKSSPTLPVYPSRIRAGFIIFQNCQKDKSSLL